MKKLLALGNKHFECGFLAYLWLNGSVLAALVGRPYLGAIGFATVLPVLVAYALRSRRRDDRRFQRPS